MMSARTTPGQRTDSARCPCPLVCVRPRAGDATRVPVPTHSRPTPVLVSQVSLRRFKNSQKRDCSKRRLSMAGSGLSPSQERARSAEWMAFERANRSRSGGELARRRQARADERALAAAEWVRTNLPECVGPEFGGVCSYAIASALRVRSDRPDLRGEAFVDRVRVWRAAWLDGSLSSPAQRAERQAVAA